MFSIIGKNNYQTKRDEVRDPYAKAKNKTENLNIKIPLTQKVIITHSCGFLSLSNLLAT